MHGWGGLEADVDVSLSQLRGELLNLLDQGYHRVPLLPLNLQTFRRNRHRGRILNLRLLNRRSGGSGHIGFHGTTPTSARVNEQERDKSFLKRRAQVREGANLERRLQSLLRSLPTEI